MDLSSVRLSVSSAQHAEPLPGGFHSSDTLRSQLGLDAAEQDYTRAVLSARPLALWLLDAATHAAASDSADGVATAKNLGSLRGTADASLHSASSSTSSALRPAFPWDGANDQLLMRVAKTLEQKLKKILEKHPLQLWWFFKYIPSEKDENVKKERETSSKDITNKPNREGIGLH